MVNKLDDTIKRLQEIIKANGLKVEDKHILEQSVKLYISASIKESKEKNIQSMKEPIKTLNQELGIIEKATDKQLAYLQELGYSGTYDLTKDDAIALIREYKARKIKQ